MADEFEITESVDDIGADVFEICEGGQYIASCVDRETADRIVAALRNTRAAPEPSEAEIEAVGRELGRLMLDDEGSYVVLKDQARALIAALRAIPAASKADPDGYWLAPNEPTEAMIRAMWGVTGELTSEMKSIARENYAAMRAAAEEG
jgi:hypothetical protein